MRLSPLSWPLSALVATLVLSVAGILAILPPLNTLYAASHHPVDHATGQLAFDADKLRGYFAVMQKAGGLADYRASQILDFGLLSAIAVLFLALGTLAARLTPPGQRGHRLGLAGAGFGVAGAGCDALENLASFILLSDPVQISTLWAVVYSSLAAAKFALLAAATLAVLLALILGIAARWRAI